MSLVKNDTMFIAICQYICKQLIKLFSIMKKFQIIRLYYHHNPAAHRSGSFLLGCQLFAVIDKPPAIAGGYLVGFSCHGQTTHA